MALRRKTGSRRPPPTGNVVASYFVILAGMASCVLLSAMTFPEASESVILLVWIGAVLLLTSLIYGGTAVGIFPRPRRKRGWGWLENLSIKRKPKHHAQPLLRGWKRKQTSFVPQPHGSDYHTFVPAAYDEEEPWR